MSERERIDTDVVIVGAGPAGLACAIRCAQLAKEQSRSLSITVLEKGAEVGAHILSGAVFEPRALNALIPDWAQKGAPLDVPVTKDNFYWLTEKRSWRCPIPSLLNNHGNYIISLGRLCAWLAEQATALGVDIYPGFAATDVVTDGENKVIGIVTSDVGKDVNDRPLSDFTPGIEIHAKQVILAEGCRGSLAQKIMKTYQLQAPGQFQTYGLGFKEVWEVDSPAYQPGTVVHTVGFPLSHNLYGGGFIYHANHQRVYVGLVLGLDYKDPYLEPYAEFQRFKQHPKLRELLIGGRPLKYGARTLNEGGWQSIPNCSFPGGLLIGCSAGFLNVAKIKGSHTAMQSGIEAAEHLFNTVFNSALVEADYTQRIKDSWIGKELYRTRNIRPGFNKGLKRGMLKAGIELSWLGRLNPYTRQHRHPDHSCLEDKSQYPKREYPKPDGKLTFDKMTSLSRSNVYHRENQPIHLRLRTPTIANEVNLTRFSGPESRYCPAGVYEYLKKNNRYCLQINAQNCIHCKACDIKDPTQNIEWTPPEGGGGPNYGDM